MNYIEPQIGDIVVFNNEGGRYGHQEIIIGEEYTLIEFNDEYKRYHDCAYFLSKRGEKILVSIGKERSLSSKTNYRKYFKIKERSYEIY